MRHPLDGDSKDPIFSFTRQRDLQINSIVANGKGVSGVQVVSAVEHGLNLTKELRVGLHHGLDNLSVDLARALVRLDVDVVVVHKASRHCDLKVVGLEQNRPALAAQIWSSWAYED